MSVTVDGMVILVMLFPLNAFALIVVTLLGIETDVALGTVLLASIAVTLNVYWLFSSFTVDGMVSAPDKLDETNFASYLAGCPSCATSINVTSYVMPFLVILLPTIRALALVAYNIASNATSINLIFFMICYYSKLYLSFLVYIRVPINLYYSSN